MQCFKRVRRRGPSACPVCGREVTAVGSGIGVCPDCVKNRWEESRPLVASVHARSRRRFHLPVEPPATIEGGLRCSLCFHGCRIGKDEKGYCGVRKGTRESFRNDGRSRALVSYYFDPIPTNCVADWVCAGGTGAGFPMYAHDKGPEAGYYNLAVFFEACNLNCLYCQDWSFKGNPGVKGSVMTVDELVGIVNEKTSCICFFGGDPIPQLPYALSVVDRLRRAAPERILRICWETNATAHPGWLKRMARASLDSGGCVKVDLKAWDPRIHTALCGFDNSRVLENFQRLAQWVPLRPHPPLLIASTLLVPGYVDEEEVWNLASFIARIDPEIPYTLLAFAPEFHMRGFPTTSRAQADACMAAAVKAGLRNIRIGNGHLIH